MPPSRYGAESEPANKDKGRETGMQDSAKRQPDIPVVAGILFPSKMSPGGLSWPS